MVPIRATPPPAMSCFIPWDFAPGLSLPYPSIRLIAPQIPRPVQVRLQVSVMFLLRSEKMPCFNSSKLFFRDIFIPLPRPGRLFTVTCRIPCSGIRLCAHIAVFAKVSSKLGLWLITRVNKKPLSSSLYRRMVRADYSVKSMTSYSSSAFSFSVWLKNFTTSK